MIPIACYWRQHHFSGKNDQLEFQKFVIWALISIAFKNNLEITSGERFWCNNKFFFWKEMYRIFFFYKNVFLGIPLASLPPVTALWYMLHLSFWFQCNEWPQKCRFRHQHFVFSNNENILQKNNIFVAAIFILYKWWKKCILK